MIGYTNINELIRRDKNVSLDELEMLDMLNKEFILSNIINLESKTSLEYVNADILIQDALYKKGNLSLEDYLGIKEENYFFTEGLRNLLYNPDNELLADYN